MVCRRIAVAGLQYPAFEPVPRGPSALLTALPEPKHGVVQVCFSPEDLVEGAAEVARDLQVRIPEDVVAPFEQGPGSLGDSSGEAILSRVVVGTTW